MLHELRMPTKVSDTDVGMGARQGLGLLDAGAFGRFYRKADVSWSRKDFNAVAEKYYKGGFAVRPVVSSYTGFLARARDQHRAAVIERRADAAEEARIEARKDVQRWARSGSSSSRAQEGDQGEKSRARSAARALKRVQRATVEPRGGA